MTSPPIPPTSDPSRYDDDPLTELEAADPLALFGEWLEEASASELNDPNAMALATVDTSGLPDLRMVLLKDFDADGFVFFTNLDSAKGRQLAGVAKAALLFHWKSLRRQVRLRGDVEPVEAAEADAYFATRARLSQLGAWASDQSRALESRAELRRRVGEQAARFGDGPVPRPPHWSGFRLRPGAIEFWRDRAFRLHERLLFTRTAEGWERGRLFP